MTYQPGEGGYLHKITTSSGQPVHFTTLYKNMVNIISRGHLDHKGYQVQVDLATSDFEEENSTPMQSSMLKYPIQYFKFLTM